MAASTETSNLEKPKLADDWTVVLPRRGQQKRSVHKSFAPHVCKREAWVPADDEWKPEKEEKLFCKMQSYIEKVEKSHFYQSILFQIEDPEMMGEFLRVRGSQDKVQMVIYGLGSIESFDSPKLQLSLAVLMKRRYSWIGEVEVFDPIISFTESKVLEALGCAVLAVNEHGQRQVSKPTLFFMPHCDAQLYVNLLMTNWRANSLNQIIIFGNSFSEYERLEQFFKTPSLTDMKNHICAIKRFSKEYSIEFATVSVISDDYFRAFQNLSWHFFNLDSEAVLESIITS